MTTRTKIICTLGPATSSYEAILALIDAGMSVARINFSHGTHEEHAKVIALLKKAREERGVPLAIMCDTKGPEIRLGEVPGGGLPCQAGTHVQLVSCNAAPHQILLTPPEVFDAMKVGMTLLFDDGYIQATVVSQQKDSVEIKILILEC